MSSNWNRSFALSSSGNGDVTQTPSNLPSSLARLRARVCRCVNTISAPLVCLRPCGRSRKPAPGLCRRGSCRSLGQHSSRLSLACLSLASCRAVLSAVLVFASLLLDLSDAHPAMTDFDLTDGNLSHCDMLL